MFGNTGCNVCEYKEKCPEAFTEKAQYCLAYDNILYNADPNCYHDVRPQLSGGVKCVKCGGWFAY